MNKLISYGIQPHRKAFIDRAVRTLRKDFNLISPVIDCVDLAKYINQEPEKFNIRIQSSTELSSNTLANTIYYKDFDLYYIVVNRSQLFDENGKSKYPYRKSSDRAVNFTLAHEFGHIYLEHAYIPDSEKTNEDIYLEELEADEFAGRLLMPEKTLLSANFSSLGSVAKTFNVSLSALNVRLKVLDVLDIKTTNIFPTCESCGNTHFEPGDVYCSICSSPCHPAKGVLTMRYDDGFIINDEDRLTSCPRCNSTHFKPADRFCMVCGLPLFNKCSNPDCSVGTISNSSARYCTKCGSPTTFFSGGVLQSWKVTRDAQLCLETVEDETLGQGKVEYFSSQEWLDFILEIDLQHKSLATLLMHSSARYSNEKLLIIFRKNADKFRFLSKKSHIKLVTDTFKSFFYLPLATVNSTSFEEYLPAMFID